MTRPGLLGGLGRSRRARWVFAGLGALALVMGWGSAAAAGPARPAAPDGVRSSSGAAEVAEAADVVGLAAPDDCRWKVVDMPGGSKTAQLWCGDKLKPHTEVDNDQEPPLPNGCRHETVKHGLGDQGPTDEIKCEDWVPLADNSKEWVQCRDEHDFWFDDHLSVQIPKDAPQWWKDEIRIESEADEGRGCQIAKHVPQPMCKQLDLEKYNPPGLLPDQCWGTYPSANYSVTWLSLIHI